jgi:hypothetical protein
MGMFSDVYMFVFLKKQIKAFSTKDCVKLFSIDRPSSHSTLEIKQSAENIGLVNEV